MTVLELTPGSRARQLFDRLEQAFQGFLEQLPAGLEALARQRGTYHGDGASQPFQGLGQLNPVLVGTPWLFWETFQGLEDDTFVQLAEAGAFFVLASVLLDHLVDGQIPDPGRSAVYHQALFSRGASIYRQVLSGDAAFWDAFDRLGGEHVASLAAESSAQEYPQELTCDTLRCMAHGKVAPIVATLAAFCAASRQMALFPALEDSLKHISVASQLLDDIGDWQADVRNRHLTYFLTRLKPPETWKEPDWPDIEGLQTSLDQEWLDVIELKRVMEGLDRAIEDVAGLDCPAWVAYVNGYRTLTDRHLEHRIRRHFGGQVS